MYGKNEKCVVAPKMDFGTARIQNLRILIQTRQEKGFLSLNITRTLSTYKVYWYSASTYVMNVLNYLSISKNQLKTKLRIWNVKKSQRSGSGKNILDP
jgi:hypothetical protein